MHAPLSTSTVLPGYAKEPTLPTPLLVTDSAAGWKSTSLFQPLPAPALVEVGRMACLPGSSGRGWKNPIERAPLVA